MTLLQRRLEQVRKQQEGTDTPEEIRRKSPTSSKINIFREIKEKVLRKIAEEMDMEALEKLSARERKQYISQEVGNMIESVVKEMDTSLSRGDHHRLIGEVVSDITGYGPITGLLADPTVTEIMVNGYQKVYVERAGKLEFTDITFRDDQHVMNIIERIVVPLGKRIDDSSPRVDARLPDGSRVNAVIPPVALDGPILTIRKFSKEPFTISDLVRFGTLTSNMAMFIKACVSGRLNIVVGGGTGSGKTSTLNVLSSFISNTERIVTIEDAAELKLMQDHVVRMEVRPPNIEGKGQIPIRDLVINSLRMRPDRIIVGEVRGGEALDMLQAMNTGHDGSITTGHANSPRDLLTRLETMVLMAGVEIPVRAIREQISSALDLIIYQNRMKDGTRKITKITEVLGMEGDTITLQDIFTFEEKEIGENGKVIGEFRPTGVVPKCLPVLAARGIHVPFSIFA